MQKIEITDDEVCEFSARFMVLSSEPVRPVRRVHLAVFLRQNQADGVLVNQNLLPSVFITLII